MSGINRRLLPSVMPNGISKVMASIASVSSCSLTQLTSFLFTASVSHSESPEMTFFIPFCDCSIITLTEGIT